MKIPVKMVQGIFTAALVITHKTNTTPLYPLKNAAAEFVFSKPVFESKWDIDFHKYPIDKGLIMQDEMPLDFASELSPLDAVSMFLKEVQTKEVLIPIINDVITTGLAFSGVSYENKTDLKDKLSTVKDSHSENKEHINTLTQVKKVAPSMADLIDKELRVVLQQKIDPKSIDIICKVLRTSGKVASSVLPTLRALNHLSAAYDAAKVLYPEQTKNLENYIVDKLQSHAGAAQQSVTNAVTNTTASFKSRLSAIKADNLTETVLNSAENTSGLLKR